MDDMIGILRAHLRDATAKTSKLADMTQDQCPACHGRREGAHSQHVSYWEGKVIGLQLALSVVEQNS